MNILVQAPKYANEPARRCNSFIAAFIAAFILFYCRRPYMSAINAAIFIAAFIAAFILFYFTCAAGLIVQISHQRGHFDLKFQVEGVAPTNNFCTDS